MNINAQDGHKVVFAHPESGRHHDQEIAKRHLIAGETYTVERTDVDNWSTDVYLKEVPGVPFNSVHFEDAKQ